MEISSATSCFAPPLHICQGPFKFCQPPWQADYSFSPHGKLPDTIWTLVPAAHPRLCHIGSLYIGLSFCDHPYILLATYIYLEEKLYSWKYHVPYGRLGGSVGWSESIFIQIHCMKYEFFIDISFLCWLCTIEYPSTMSSSTFYLVSLTENHFVFLWGNFRLCT